MKGHGSKFPRKFEEAVVAFLTHRTIENAAAAVGISTRTLKNWIKQPEFEEAKQKALREIHNQAGTRLVQNSNVASGVVLKMIADPSIPPAIKFKAAKFVLEYSGETIELRELERRITDIECSRNKRKKGTN